MLYPVFIFQAKEKTIQQLDNGLWCLEPEWKDVICRDISTLENVEDCYLSDWKEVEDVLLLEVKRRNLITSKKAEVINWLYELITASIEPAVLAEENDYIKNLIEYMKLNHASSGNPEEGVANG